MSFWEEDISASVCAQVGLWAVGRTKGATGGEAVKRLHILMCSAYLPERFVENVLRCALPELRIKVKFLKKLKKKKKRPTKLSFPFVFQVLDLSV